ncbi:MAG TPA: terminase gpA endonuclease subunit, partial [Coriobacteriia bacterium]|nr:terminase gpA endonuclease subunit [Coriobacteriia bacterium]
NGTRSVRLVPCPHCGTFQELTFFGESATNYMRPDQKPDEPPPEDYPLAERLGRVRFDHCRDVVTHIRPDGTTEEKPGRWNKERIRTDTYYECVTGCRIDFAAPFARAMLDDPVAGPSFTAEVRARVADGVRMQIKHAMMLSGRWLATNPRPHPRRRSRHISDLYSLYDDLSLPELALLWIDALGDAEKLRHFFNNNLGLVFSPKLATIDESLVLELRADYTRGSCPFTPDLVLLDFDTQQYHYAAIVTAWLVDGTCAVIDWFDAIADEDIVARFDQRIPGAPRRIHPQPEQRDAPIAAVVPQYGLGDAAGCKGRTPDVYDLTLKLPGRLYASFGRGGLQITTPIAPRTVEWRMRPIPIYLFSDDTFKTKLYVDRISRIKEIKTAQSAGKDPVLFNLPPRLYLPRDADGKLVAELAGERQLPDLSWQDPAPGPNHLGDALKNALVQFEYLLPRLQASKAAEAAARAKAAAASATPGAASSSAS